MKFIVKLHPEIIMKSESVRKRFTKILDSNIRNLLKKRGADTSVYNRWDHIDVTLKNDVDYPLVLDTLIKIPGIHHILEVEQSTYTDKHDIFLQTLPTVATQIEGKTFCVRVKRRGHQDFSSIEIERYVGGGLNQAVATATVQLTRPEVTVLLEIDHDKLNMVKQRHKGLGGFPLGTQEDLISLISGGYDSGVSSYLHIKRGSKVHYCFFNLGGEAHQQGVQQVAYHLWHEYGSSAKVKFITINFEPVVAEILEKIDDALMGVVLKRMFIRAASFVADKFGVQGLITGEALGQVSSQTLTNLRVIDQVTDQLILRPLIAWDKEDIIDLAKKIGTEFYAKTMPEYCGVISKKPTIKAEVYKILEAESSFNFKILDQVIYDAEMIDIRQLAPQLEVNETQSMQPQSMNVVMISELDFSIANQVLLDIRNDEEREQAPLLVGDLGDGSPIEMQQMPFFKLSNQFHTLDQSKQYLLYCDRGVMSRLQALHLMSQGFHNVAVYRPH